ncbi:C-C motif chemokine 24 isoform X2 [Ovis aries]|uniref:C-C motif chemokine 24 isoform X2 n=1 Tax=Ovis aries TaxID=9940 RepID=UPI0029526477|nr:C-C motif chemokine 24 isoform X2 [Ovis aries]
MYRRIPSLPSRPLLPTYSPRHERRGDIFLDLVLRLATLSPPGHGRARDPGNQPPALGPVHHPCSFTTRKGQKFCGNPKLPWVQKYMKNLDAKQKKASTGTRAMSTTAPFWRHPANSTFI